ncbi:protein NinF [Serratia marcescens]|nr:protein ninF [Serratia marcescens]HAU4317503.1 protein ninF [Serratia marcescens]HAU4343604.1 protein ninF [Serratia marcescens]HAU4392998.1 protein ninF [Serratia marcescens]HAU4409365.1 protein ninF [Serratia marcescens]
MDPCRSCICRLAVAMNCADCGNELQEDEVFVCETCDQEQRKFIESVMGEDDDG